jgi:MFS transporter, PAT family, beta-lactamase induction signal transducer AmpG
MEAHADVLVPTRSVEARVTRSRHHVHPSVFMFLIIPFGVMGGYLSVAIAYLYTKAGISVGQVAALVALSLAPHTWKFLWAPIADTTLTRKTWYLLTSVLSAVGIFATGILPTRASSLPMLSAIVLVSNIGVSFLGMSVESLMAYGAPDEEKGRAGGWFQAGNLGGSGIGGGAGLLLAQRLPAPWIAGAILAAACLACALALFFIPEPPSPHRAGSLRRDLVGVVKDLWAVAKSRRGALALILCFMPIGSGAAGGLWSAVSGDWHASVDVVALVTGILAGILAAIGCLAGGWISDRMDRKAAYACYGALQALCAIGMAIAPRTQMSYVVFTSLYSLITGLTYAGFSAFVLEAMGLGAAATKYNVFAALSNMPIYYMTMIDGSAHDRWGPSGMLFTEAALCLTGLVLFGAIWAWVTRGGKPSAAPA